MRSPNHIRLDLSDRRRVLAASDIHGEFDQLDQQLLAHNFDPLQDALILNGDLVDRGPNSLAAIDWIGRPSIYRTLGNHDIMPRLFLTGDASEEDMKQWGGQWFIDLDPDQREYVAAQLESAPVALTVLTPGGYDIGFVHADCGLDWNEHIASLENEELAGFHHARKHSLWSRDTIKNLFDALTPKDGNPAKPYSCRISGIDHVFHGHTTVLRPFAHHDRTWIDTAACFEGGMLTVLDVDKWLDDIERNTPFA